MTTVSIRDLRNHGGDVIDRVTQGERLTITRAGKAVAELHPLAAPALPAPELLRRWGRLPDLDAGALRADVDETFDASL